MRYEDLFVGILIITLLVIAAARILLPHRDDQNETLSSGDARRVSEGQLSGRGIETSAPLKLAAGLYRIDYDFEALTRLALLDPRDGGDETLVIASGTGETSVEIERAGRYRLHVEPPDASAAWRIHYRSVFTRSEG